MVQSELVERFDAVVSVMTEQEARLCESSIIKHFQEARDELTRFYEGRGWDVLGYASFWGWAESMGGKVRGVNPQYLYNYVKASFAARELSTMVESSHIPERQLRPLTQFVSLPDTRTKDGSVSIDGDAIRAAWDEANERTDGKPTARVVADVVREMRADPVNDELDPPMEAAQAADIQRAAQPTRVNAGLFTSATPEWYTPGKIIERVEGVFGEIDLDPCSNSSERATANVPAGAYWTKDDNGLAQPWHGKVYMNPPYGDEIPAWVERLVNAYTAGEIIEGIALLPARTDTAWFQPLFDYPICFVRGRLKFSGAENSAPFPSAVVYVGPDVALFEDWFHDIGRITKPEA